MTINNPRITLQTNLFAHRVFDMIKVCSERTSTGLAFVPIVIEKLDDIEPEQVRRMLLLFDRIGVIELRPDGGLGRFTSRELAVCPEGPQGSRLLWIRITGTPLPP